LSRGKIVEIGKDGRVTLQMPLPVVNLLIDAQAEVEALAVQCGLLLMKACIESEVEQVAGPRYVHQEERRAVRAGQTPTWAFYSGRKVGYRRQRVRGESGEIPLVSVSAFQKDGRMQRSVAAKVLSGVKMRRYEQCLDDVCEGYGVDKSCVSRHWVNASAQALKNLAERRLENLDLAVIVVDGLRFKETLVVVALGVDCKGYKQVLGLYAGATENATTCKNLLEDLIRRGLDVKRKYLWVIDGSKALRSAIRSVFGEDALVQRCQVHKKRNVKDHLPRSYHRTLSLRLSAAYGMAAYADAKAELDKTVKWLEGVSPSAAESLREGLEETLTVHGLGVAELLRRSLSSTNLIESCFSTTRERSRSVKRWRGEDQVMRWAGTVLLDAEKHFRRVRGYAAMPALLSKIGNEPLETQRVGA